MFKTLLAALAATVIFSGATLATRAAAMPLVAPSALGAASAPDALVERVTNICGSNGCTSVYTKRIVRPRRPGKLVARPIVVQPAPNLRQSLGLSR